jgi:hypothetical protein
MRFVVGACVLAAVVTISAVSARSSNCGPTAPRAEYPSKLDYLVLASFADSANLTALSAHRTMQ